MARFDLNLLSALNALLSDKNVTRAAERLKVTQPTMSGMLQRLRYQFDDQLLVRNGRELELTPFGASLVEPVREALRSVELLILTEPVFDPRTSTREFTLMSSNYCASLFLPLVVAHVSARAPGVRLILKPIHNPIERIFAGEVDLCIAPDDRSLTAAHSGAEKIHSELLFSDEFVCVVAKDHSLDAHSDIDEVFSFPHVGVQPCGTDTTIEATWIRRLRPEYKPQAIVAEFPLVAPMVSHSKLVGIMPARMAKLSARAMSIRTFYPPYAMPTADEALMWHSRHMQDPAHIWLRGVVQDIAAAWLGKSESRVAVATTSAVRVARQPATLHPIS
jgi:DNA-binding transcriptional LysR family regulator